MTDIIDRLAAVNGRLQLFPTLPTSVLRQEAATLSQDVASAIRLASSEIQLLRERESQRDTLPAPATPTPRLSSRSRLYASGNRKRLPC